LVAELKDAHAELPLTPVVPHGELADPQGAATPMLRTANSTSPDTSGATQEVLLPDEPLA